MNKSEVKITEFKNSKKKRKHLELFNLKFRIAIRFPMNFFSIS